VGMTVLGASRLLRHIRQYQRRIPGTAWAA